MTAGILADIETALSLLSGLPDASPRVWAALSTSGMSGLILPPCVAASLSSMYSWLNSHTFLAKGSGFVVFGTS